MFPRRKYAEFLFQGRRDASESSYTPPYPHSLSPFRPSHVSPPMTSPGASSSTSTERPFTLAVPQEEIDLLRAKLALMRLPDELDGAGWTYGTPLADVRRLAARWGDAFDWRAAEGAIDEIPMYTRDMEVEAHGTLNVHYIH